jgi:thymidine kinase
MSNFKINKKCGELHLIIGPMYAGKSTELIRRINRYKFLGYNVLCINHSINCRYGSCNIITHNKEEFTECHSIDSLQKLFDEELKELYEKADVIIIEEIQFFKDAFEIINKVVDIDNKVVVAAGLVSDFNREPFGDVLKLIPISDTFVQLQALCSRCKDGTPASFTRRNTHDKEKELVGSFGVYEAVCRYHYFTPFNI